MGVSNNELSAELKTRIQDYETTKNEVAQLTSRLDRIKALLTQLFAKDSPKNDQMNGAKSSQASPLSEQQPKGQPKGTISKRQLSHLQTYLGGIKYMTGLPDIVIIIDQQEEYMALQECVTLGSCIPSN